MDSARSSVPRVKICGIARESDARMVVRSGADALGFLVDLNYETNDQLETEQAARLVAGLPPFVSSVLVTHTEELDRVVWLCRRIRPNVVQLHGNFTVAEIPRLREELPGLNVLKAIHVTGDEAIERAHRAAEFADGLVLDTRTETRLGGTGLTHDWSISKEICCQVRVPVILAGGLDPGNIETAIRYVRPFAVDVNSGVSCQPGIKSEEKVVDFVRTARVPVERMETSLSM